MGAGLAAAPPPGPPTEGVAWRVAAAAEGLAGAARGWRAARRACASLRAAKSTGAQREVGS